MAHPVPPGFEYCPEVSSARWVEEALSQSPGEIGYVARAVIPGSYDAYARVLHPVVTRGGDTVRWRDIAALTGRTVHPEVQFRRLVQPVDNVARPWRDGVPDEGRLAPDDSAALVAILRRHTTTPGHCWFAVWSGHGATFPPEVRDGPQVRIPWREFVLYRGAIDTMARTPTGGEPTWDEIGSVTANMWWPDDRAWFVSSEIDQPWTYVAGTRACVDEVLADERLEAIPSGPESNMTVAGDTVNAALGPHEGPRARGVTDGMEWTLAVSETGTGPYAFVTLEVGGEMVGSAECAVPWVGQTGTGWGSQRVRDGRFAVARPAPAGTRRAWAEFPDGSRVSLEVVEIPEENGAVAFGVVPDHRGWTLQTA